MGNESSTPISEDVPPFTLKSRTVEAVAEYIKSHNVKRIVVMTGAGISTSAGIPDFRSPETGLYANLARLNLPYAEAVFDISYFRNNPRPFYELAHELYPGKYRPTITHSFISLLHKKGMLLKAFTQNIDCLEREAGVPGDKIVEAHGSFATQRCIECGLEYPAEAMRTAVSIKEVPYCERTKCGGLVKPDIVFFGEALPENFHQNRSLPASADLAIVMGTSLSVQPFASLPSFVMEDVPRVLINMDRVGGLGSRPDDVLLLEDCDGGVRKLADALGWRNELEALWQSTRPKASAITIEEDARDEQTKLDDKVAELTQSIDRTLKLSNDHKEQFAKDFARGEDAAVLTGPSAQDKLASGSTEPGELSKHAEGLSHVFPHIVVDKPEKPSL